MALPWKLTVLSIVGLALVITTACWWSRNNLRSWQWGATLSAHGILESKVKSVTGDVLEVAEYYNSPTGAVVLHGKRRRLLPNSSSNSMIFVEVYVHGKRTNSFYDNIGLDEILSESGMVTAK
jgi:hypothetical protein